MKTIYILIIIAGIVLPLLDVHSSWLSNNNPEVQETTGFFRNGDGTANITKLFFSKFIFWGIAVAVYFIADYPEITRYVGFLFLAIVSIPYMVKNYRVNARYS